MIRWLVGLLFVVSARADVLFDETFDSGIDSWTSSEASKGDSKYDGEWKVTSEVEKFGETSVNNSALMIGQASRHYCLSRQINPPIRFGDTDIVVQYSVQFTKTMACGGSYLKLLSATPDLALASVTDTTPYTILFGPDKCGGDQYLRFIFRFKSPVTEEYSEVHARRIKEPHKIFRDKKTHLLTLVLKAELNEFAMYVDEEEVMAGGLGADDRFQPALSPPAKIADPEDFKPADWVDAEFIDDPTDVKPEDWVDAETILDPHATKPEDWDEDMDGEWEAPDIKNPEFKGVWRAKKIKNPEYVGPWEAKQIENPEWFEEAEPMRKLDPIGAVTFELWTTTSGITFDDLIITNSVDEAHAAAEHWRMRRAQEDENDAVSPYAIFKKAASAVWGKIVALVALFMDPELFEREASPWIEQAIENPLLGGLMGLVLLSPFILLISVLCCRGSSRDDVDLTADDELEEDEDEDEGENEAAGESDASDGEKQPDQAT